MLNKVILMGRLVDEPELKTTPNGTSVTSFRVAVERDYKANDGERPADFPTIVCWRSTAEFVCRYFGKGNMIAIEGQVQTRSYQSKDGKNHIATEIMAEKVSFTGEKSKAQTAPQTQQQATVPQQPTAPTQATVPAQAVQQTSAPQQNTISNEYEPTLFTDDDLPF